MAEKRGTDSTLATDQPSVTGNNKSIMVPQKVVPTNLIITKKKLERWSFSPNHGGYNPHPAIGAYISAFGSTSAVLFGITDCLPSGKQVSQFQHLKGALFIDQVVGDIYTYNYDNTLLISLEDHSTVEDLKSYLND